MLIGTNRLFRIVYFITAMSPAYLLFTTAFIPNSGELLQLEWPIFVSGALIALFVELLVSAALTWVLIRLLNQQSSLKTGGVKTEVVKRKMNEGLVEFLMGTAVSSTIGLSLSTSRPILAIVILCVFQFLLFLLFQSSTNSMPNVFLVLGGWSYVRWGDGYLFMRSRDFRDLAGQKAQGTPIGDSISGSYVIIRGNEGKFSD